MPTWLAIAIWTFWTIWTLFEVLSLSFVIQENKRRTIPIKYATAGVIQTFLWAIMTIFWLCYSIFG